MEISLLGRIRAAGLFLPAAFALAALAVLVSLGTWQLNRKVWKDGLLAAIAARQVAVPVPLPEALAAYQRAPADADYVRVRLRGTFDHAEERHVYAPRNAGPGWHVYTLFKPAPGGPPLFVNRGWVAEAVKDPALRAAGQVSSVVEVTGIVRLPEVKATFTPDNDFKTNRWYWRDLDGMRWGARGTPDAAALAAMRLQQYAPFFVEADAAPANPGGWPQGGVTYVAISNRHLEYAGTWYGLALTLIGVFAAFAHGRLRVTGTP
jgi:surfeit locus 1 family protein